MYNVNQLLGYWADCANGQFGPSQVVGSVFAMHKFLGEDPCDESVCTLPEAGPAPDGMVVMLPYAKALLSRVYTHLATVVEEDEGYAEYCNNLGLNP